MSTLLDIRKLFVDRSGHYELVVDAENGDYSDNGADEYIRAGQRWLDRNCPSPVRDELRRFQVAPGQYTLDCDLRYVKRIDAYPGGVRRMLNPVTLDWMRDNYVQPWGENEAGTPSHWVRSPDQIETSQPNTWEQLSFGAFPGDHVLPFVFGEKLCVLSRTFTGVLAKCSIWSSIDGREWSKMADAPDGMTGIVVFGDYLFGVVQDYEDIVTIMRSSDGLEWSVVAEDVFETNLELYRLSVPSFTVHNGELWLSLYTGWVGGGSDSTLHKSLDGVTWETVGPIENPIFFAAGGWLWLSDILSGVFDVYRSLDGVNWDVVSSVSGWPTTIFENNGTVYSTVLNNDGVNLFEFASGSFVLVDMEDALFHAVYSGVSFNGDIYLLSYGVVLRIILASDAILQPADLLFMPPSSESITMEVLGGAYAYEMREDSDVSWWSDRHPEILVRAARMQLEIDRHRNSTGVKDFVEMLLADVKSIYHEQVAERTAGPPSRFRSGVPTL